MNNSIKNGVTPETMLADISRKIKQYRILYPMTQEELAQKSMVSIATIRRFEAGRDISFLKLISILRTLDLYENLKILVPDQTERPLFQLEEKNRKRASKKKKAQTEWKWGDEK